MIRRTVPVVVRRTVPVVVIVAYLAVHAAAAHAALRAGAFAQDVTPTEFPVIVNGNFAEVVATRANHKLHARAIVLDDGKERVAIVVVDSCMLPRELLDDAKSRASKLTGIAVDKMMISATHTHSAPSAMGCLGSDADANYVKLLPDLLARSIERANANLAPAQIGATVVNAAEHTFTRRWVFRADRMRRDPFGDLTVRANMHPGYQSPDAIAPSGPPDPGLSVVAIRRAADNKPLALLANFSMHYVGAAPLSADYYGRFAGKIGKLIDADEAFVGVMSQGTSGDSWLGDYAGAKPPKGANIEDYSDAIAAKTAEAFKTIKYTADAPLAMRETTLKSTRRAPDDKRLAWAKETLAKMKDKKPRAQADIYAREAVMLHEEPERELKLQALRIGDVAIAAWPNEVYALSGLKVKAMSPLPLTFNVSLANGSEGYIPPPEQFVLGGYTTWPARTAALVPEAEPKIVEALVGLLESVSGQKRRKPAYPAGPYAQAILAAKPAAYYRMGEMTPAAGAVDAAGGAAAAYEPGVVFYLPGPNSPAFTGDAAIASRAAHFAGGRMKTTLPAAATKSYTVEFLVWNGLPAAARPVTAYLFSRGPDADKTAPGDHLGIGGTHEGGGNAGKLIFFTGNARDTLIAGKTALSQRGWHHVALVRDGNKIAAYLDGKLEITGDAESTSDATTAFFGGRCDNFANLEGKLCEAAIFARALTAEEIAAHAKSAALPAPPPAPKADATPAAAPAVSNAQAALRAARPPRSPEETLKSLHIPPDMTVELVAAEPLIDSPVALDWGPDGKLWVVEMIDYPYGMDGKGKPGGRIKYLESTKNDGRYDKATTFLENVRMPNGIITWGKGVIVTAAPEVFYAEDTDNDGKADRREVLFKGFKEGNPQLRVNGLRWGLDNWLYLANGWSAGVVESVKTGQKLDLKGKDLRVRPDTGEMELVSGVSQFGREPDDVGRWFGVDNAHPLFHYVLEDRYARRNPHVSFGDGKVQLLPLPLSPVFPRSPFTKRYIGLDHHGHYTSACGINVYRDNLLFQDGLAASAAGSPARKLHVLICEPVHNLIQLQQLTESGTTFTAKRIDGQPNTDFVAGEDPWFRPVMTRTGPDGAVYIVDMYRYMIEHPDWLNPAGKAELAPFYREGEGRGRIYRLFPKDKKPREIPRLDNMTTEQLVATLHSPSGHTCDLAHRLIVQRADTGAAAAALGSTLAQSTNALARLHALCALDGLAGGKALPDDLVAAALADAHPAVRTHAVRIAEPRLAKNPDLLAAVCKLANDPSPHVRQQLAHTLSVSDTSAAALALRTVATTAGSDAGITNAVLMSATPPRFGPIVDLVVNEKAASQGIYAALVDIALSTGERSQLAKLLAMLERDRPGLPAAQAYAAVLDKLAARRMVPEMLAREDALAATFNRLNKLFDAARTTVADAAADPAERAAACALLGRRADTKADELKLLSTLFTPQTAAEVQLAAIKAAARTADASVPTVLLANWPSLSPTVRTAVADALLPREPWALGSAKSPAAKDLDFSRKERLQNHASAKVKEAAKATIAQAAVNADRQKVIDSYAPALTLPGDLKRGQAVYAEHCATCHKVGSLALGHEIGPNLLTTREWTKENLLAAILDPNRTVEPRYLAYTATTADNTTLTGLVTNESAGSVTLQTLDAKTHALPRPTLKSLTSTNQSLMPAGFESAIDAQAMADLFAFIQSPTAPR